jgi:hypothetical protein
MKGNVINNGLKLKPEAWRKVLKQRVVCGGKVLTFSRVYASMHLVHCPGIQIFVLVEPTLSGQYEPCSTLLSKRLLHLSSPIHARGEVASVSNKLNVEISRSKKVSMTH